MDEGKVQTCVKGVYFSIQTFEVDGEVDVFVKALTKNPVTGKVIEFDESWMKVSKNENK